MNQPLPNVLRDLRRNRILPGRQLGKGGEGAVFEVKSRSDLAMKLYWPDKAASHCAKITAMAAAAWSQTNVPVAFPVDVLYTSAGVFAGFTMPRVVGHKPVHLLYSPSSRRIEFAAANFPFLVRAALNTAKAVANVHDAGCVIGDVNHSGFLVSQNAMVALIDSDSFQFTVQGRRFLCEVGTIDYTPPELHGANFHHVQRTRNHDNFGLAVLIFHLLFLGRHPYAGRTTPPRDMPLGRAISEFRFAYSASPTGLAPPPNAPLLSDFPNDLAQAFHAAFGRSGLRGRPDPQTWVAILRKVAHAMPQQFSASTRGR
jgi:DNA-binding helix-hairpin-helix protein with protein kinase domain